MQGIRSYFSVHNTFLRDVVAAAALTAGIGGALADEGVGGSGGKLADVPGGHIEFLGGSADSLMMFNVTNAKERVVELKDAIASAFLKSKHRAEEIRLILVEPGWLAGEPSLPPEPGSDVTVVIEWSDGRQMRSIFLVK